MDSTDNLNGSLLWKVYSHTSWPIFTHGLKLIQDLLGLLLLPSPPILLQLCHSLLLLHRQTQQLDDMGRKPYGSLQLLILILTNIYVASISWQTTYYTISMISNPKILRYSINDKSPYPKILLNFVFYY